jgi:NAD(P)-dependent dehydrogenase (short-subunit alcohol dehydrogenase family)
MAGRFAGKSVLVAGGTGALGRAVALAFLDESANVVVTYRKQEEFDALTRAGAAKATNGSSLEGHQLDVTDEAAARRLIEGILASRGRVDVLVNAVGGYTGGLALWETDPKVFEQMLALNLRSGYVLSRVIVPLMLKQRSGAIVNVAARAAVDHAAGAAAYAASKAAAVAMIGSLAADLKGTGVRANTVLPSLFDTEANRRAMPNADFSKWPKPEEIARVILFLCSDDARLIHGASVPVYGTT